MTDEEYIRKAVELADGWRVSYHANGEVCTISNQDKLWQIGWCQSQLDALAAQLVRQVDSSPYRIESDLNGECWIWDSLDSTDGYPLETAEGPDRTMNTIKAIVDSGVLDDG